MTFLSEKKKIKIYREDILYFNCKRVYFIYKGAIYTSLKAKTRGKKTHIGGIRSCKESIRALWVYKNTISPYHGLTNKSNSAKKTRAEILKGLRRFADA